MANKLVVTQVRSVIGYPRDQRDTVRSLGLRRLHATVEVDDTPVARGMLHKVRHLVTVEEKS
jgi:large subunit ribosomal protein L30